MGLRENLQQETVKKLAVREVVTVSPDTSVREVMRQMRDLKIGCAVVVSPDRKAIGIYTESMVIEMLANHPHTIDEPIERHMARTPWVRESDPIADVLEAMQLNNTRHLCVVDEQDQVVGVTGQRGLMEYIADHFSGQVTVQRIGMKPYLANREGA